ncbi:MAG: hypothetical protein OQL28_04325 [Sedimenticola sp.]|nr:hypothetical protein [Sedimenticola sp.]
MGLLKKRKQNKNSVGLGFHVDGLSLVAMDRSGSEPRILQCVFSSQDPADEPAESLVQAVRRHGLKGARVTAVLGPSAYSLFQVEAPEVEQEELASAIRWRVKDLLDFHIDDAVIDLFDMPTSERRSGPRMIYVVVSRRAFIQRCVDQMESLGLDIGAIDITELALRNVMATNLPGEGFHALLYLPPHYGMIQIVQGDAIFLSRRIEISGNDLEEQGGFGLEEQLETLVLELQRSLDYHESHFGLGPVSGISIIAPESRKTQLQALADQGLAAPVQLLDLSPCLGGIGDLDPATLYRSLPAIGAALRDD